VTADLEIGLFQIAGATQTARSKVEISSGIPYLVFGISLLLLFALVDKLLTDWFGVYIGLGLHAIVIGHVVVTLPYTILTILPLLERLSISLEEAAKDSGRTRKRRSGA
jgi:ABC-type spermidine/putrescine transport system permease subunit II